MLKINTKILYKFSDKKLCSQKWKFFVQLFLKVGGYGWNPKIKQYSFQSLKYFYWKFTIYNIFNIILFCQNIWALFQTSPAFFKKWGKNFTGKLRFPNCKRNFYICKSITINSGRLLIRNGNVLFPSPLLIIIVVLFFVWTPFVYFGKNPWCGANIPPTKGIRICPPWACPVSTISISYWLYTSSNSGLWESNIWISSFSISVSTDNDN